MKLKELFEQKEISVLTVMGQQPKEVGGDFWCTTKQLTSLVGSPKKVEGDFNCFKNNLTSFNGAPTSIGGILDADYNKFTNLKDIHKHIKFIGAYALFRQSPIKSHVVGLLLIEGLTEVYLDNIQVEAIINKHLAADRDVFACIDELEEAGFPEFAQI